MNYSKVDSLKQNSSEVLKAETAALLFNLGKTHVGFWEKKLGKILYTGDFKGKFGYDKFKNYKDYYKEDFYKVDFDTSKYNQKGNGNELLDFLNEKINLDFVDNANQNRIEIELIEIAKGDVSKSDVIKKIFFRGCENINSGIDKGNPPKNQKLSEMWLSNAFGSFREKVDINNLDEKRISFLENLFIFLNSKGYLKKSDKLDKSEWAQIRKYIFNKIEEWYSHLLSDSRYPINDVTLWEQAYMTTTMFKNALAAMIMDNDKYKKYMDNPQNIKWCILGIQYDKKSLSEKAVKCAYIQAYREMIDKIDERVKELIETEYGLGNEIYRDETGVYFLAPENISGNKIDETAFYKLHDDLSIIKEEIYDIFKKESDSEIFPCIICTEKSRGLLTLSGLLENAKEHFLMKEIHSLPVIKQTSSGICQVCGVRTAEISEDDYNLCNICNERKQRKLESWFENLPKETIWTGELQDQNGRIALVSLKFDLGLWLNGEMMSGLLIREGESDANKSIFIEILEDIKNNLYNTDNFHSNSNINSFIKYFDEDSIQTIFNNITEINNYETYLKQPFSGLRYENKEKKELLFKVIENLYEERNQSFNADFANDVKAQFGSDGIKFENDKFNRINQKLNYYIRDLVSLGFIILQIKRLIFERIVHSKDEIISQLIISKKINIEKEKIDWVSLENKDRETLAVLLYQFLITKSPSPARLKRIWDSTQNFMEEVNENAHKYLQLEGEEYRNYRLVFNMDNSCPEGEYKYGECEFYCKGGKVYLITSLSKALKFIATNVEKAKEILNSKDTGKIEELKKYIKEIRIKKTEQNKKGKEIELKPGNLSIINVHRYKPSFTITAPTPVSTQLIIPADRLESFIENVKGLYIKHFKWIYGKLPLQVGIVIQDYKMPLYMGIKALRKMEKRLEKSEDIEKTALTLDSNEMEKLFNKMKSEEDYHKKSNDIHRFYSLYRTDGQGEFKFFFLNREENFKLPPTSNNSNPQPNKYIIYPNTVDFEFLDTNTRINDIYYDNKGTYKRYLNIKKNRPYTWEEWEKFKIFKELFCDNLSSKLNNLVSLIYSKLYDWQALDGKNSLEFKQFCTATFYNVLELKNNEEIIPKLLNMLGISGIDIAGLKECFVEKVLALDNEKFLSGILMFLDMYEFWHKALKEVKKMANNIVSEIKIFAKATDPVYIGTGGYTIGRVDNTIVRDPISRVPKIPGSSLAGTWRFYSAFYLQGKWKDIEEQWPKFGEKESFLNCYIEHLKNEKDYKIDKEDKDLPAKLKNESLRKTILKLRHIFWKNGEKSLRAFWDDFLPRLFKYIKEWASKNIGNEKEREEVIKEINEITEEIKHGIYSTVYCAGKDDAPQEEINEEDANKDTIKAHCGKCIVCKSFGYSKNSKSWQGMLFFSDLEIVLFPVYTRLGTKFVTVEEKIKYSDDNLEKNGSAEAAYKYDDESGTEWINLGWLNVKVKKDESKKSDYKLGDITINAKDIITVPEPIFSQVVNANLEVRTSVSIDPLTGTAKEGALFTSEAIPRGTIFYGNVRVFDKSVFSNDALPEVEEVKNMLYKSKHYFETLGIGGLTTRGFGRIKITSNDLKCNKPESAQNSTNNTSPETSPGGEGAAKKEGGCNV